MQTQTELFCVRCNQASLHDVTIEGGRVTRFSCANCGFVTRAPEWAGTAAVAGRPRLAITLDGVALGGARPAVEGTLQPDDSGAGATLPELRSLGLRLKEAGASYLRLPITLPAQFGLIRPLREGTGLPIVADLEHHWEWIETALQAGAATVAISLISGEQAPAAAEALAVCAGRPVCVRWCPPATPEPPSMEALLDGTLAITAALLAAGVQPVLSVPVAHLPTFIAVHRQLHQSLECMLRLEYVPFASDFFPELVWSGVGLGALLVEGVGDILALCLPGHAVGSVEATVEILAALGLHAVGQHPWREQRPNLLLYYTQKALRRLLTKPQRLVREIGRSPMNTARTLPVRIVTKPYRMLREIQNSLHRVG